MDSEEEKLVDRKSLPPESQEVVRIMRVEVAAGKYSDIDNEGYDRVIVAKMEQYLLDIAFEEE